MTAGTTFIYSLSDPATGVVRYVGKANNPAFRLSQHISHSQFDSSARGRWIAGLIASGLSPLLETLEEIPASDWPSVEKEYIRVISLTNRTLLNRIRVSQKIRVAGVVSTRRSEAAKLRMSSKENRDRISESLRGRIFTVEHRLNLSKSSHWRKRKTEAA